MKIWKWLQKKDFLLPDHLFWIADERFFFGESYISYGKRQKSCTLIVI